MVEIKNHVPQKKSGNIKEKVLRREREISAGRGFYGVVKTSLRNKIEQIEEGKKVYLIRRKKLLCVFFQVPTSTILGDTRTVRVREK